MRAIPRADAFRCAPLFWIMLSSVQVNPARKYRIYIDSISQEQISDVSITLFEC